MIVVSKEGSIYNCFGCGEVAYDPQYRSSQDPEKNVCNFSVNVDKWLLKGEGTERKFRYIRYNCTAFGRLADYCQYLEAGDPVVIMGRRIVDDYATNKDPKHETKYKVMLQACFVQPSAPGADNPVNYIENTGNGDYDEDDIPL